VPQSILPFQKKLQHALFPRQTEGKRNKRE